MPGLRLTERKDDSVPGPGIRLKVLLPSGWLHMAASGRRKTILISH